jgi:hypothetical protein
MSELDYAYGAFGSAAVVTLVSVGGAFYGVVTRTGTRINLPLLFTGLSVATAPVALGVILIAASEYKNAGKVVENVNSLYEKEKAQYTKYKQQEAISLIVAAVGFPFIVSGLSSLANPQTTNRRAFAAMAGAGGLTAIGGAISYGVYYSLAAGVLNELNKMP